MIRFKEEKTKIPKEIRYLVEDVINAIPDDCFDFLGNVETDMTRSLKGIADNSKMFDAYLELNNLTQLGVTAQYMLHNAQDINRMLDSNLANRYSHLNKKDFLILTNKLNELIFKLKYMPNFKKIKRLGESKMRHSNILERSSKKEFLGFGKKKTKETTLDWDKASKLIEAELQSLMRKSNIEWHPKKPEVKKDRITARSLTSATILIDKNHIAIYSNDLPDQNFEWSIENGKIKGLAKAFEALIAMDKKQGLINSDKNKKYRKESLSRNRRFESREDFDNENRFKYAVLDLNDTEIFDSEDDAYECANDWLNDVIEICKDSIKNADDETLSQWEDEDQFYYQNDDITNQIRIYKIDTDIFDEELDWKVGREIIDAEYETDSGVERIETFYTDIHSLFSDDELKELNDYYNDDLDDEDEEEW